MNRFISDLQHYLKPMIVFGVLAMFNDDTDPDAATNMLGWLLVCIWYEVVCIRYAAFQEDEDDEK